MDDDYKFYLQMKKWFSPNKTTHSYSRSMIHFIVIERTDGSVCISNFNTGILKHCSKNGLLLSTISIHNEYELGKCKTN